MRKSSTRAFVTSAEAQTGSFATDPDLKPIAPVAISELQKRIEPQNLQIIDAHRAALALLGDTIQTNILLLGYAWQRGSLPISMAALMKAIELNGVAVHAAKQAFHWGRVMAANPEIISARIGPAGGVVLLGLDEIIEHRANLLKEYQDAALSDRYRNRVESFRNVEATLLPGSDALTVAVAKYYYKVLAIKDEYEVARLLSAPSFLEGINQNFEGDFKVHFHLAPPAFAKRHPTTGILQKRTFGPWLSHILKLTAYGRKIRNTFLDPFRRTPERLAELEWIQSYEEILDMVQGNLNALNMEVCRELLTLPEQVRGYGHVRHDAASKAKVSAQRLTSSLKELKLSN